MLQLYVAVIVAIIVACIDAFSNENHVGPPRLSTFSHAQKQACLGLNLCYETQRGVCDPFTYLVCLGKHNQQPNTTVCNCLETMDLRSLDCFMRSTAILAKRINIFALFSLRPPTSCHRGSQPVGK